MNASIGTCRLSRYTAVRAVVLTALLGIVSAGAIADQSTATTTASRVMDVPLSDLDLSTAQGMRLTRDRLHTMAERICAGPGTSRDLSSQPAYAACVDSTVTDALRQINALIKTNLMVRNSVTLGASVSLADLDLSTLEGSRTARARLEAMAQRLCRELASRHDLVYQPNYGACVHDTLVRAVTQGDVIAAIRNPRAARRSTP